MNKKKQQIAKIYSKTINKLVNRTNSITNTSIITKNDAELLFMAGRQAGLEEAGIFNKEFEGSVVSDVADVLSSQYITDFISQGNKNEKD